MSELVQKVLAGDARSAARLLRNVDDRAPGHQEALRELYPHTGKAFVVGVTGNPGAGKSTLTDRLIEALRKRTAPNSPDTRTLKVGVLAVDPTSPYSGGAILGDRIRMNRHSSDPNVFIRSVATRGHLGGLSRSARDMIRVLDAFGCDVVLVETVGVGQDELEITRTAHTTLVVMAPGLGDDIQAIKAGILECADVFAVNKADRDGADATMRDLELMIALGKDALIAMGKTKGHVVHSEAHGVSEAAASLGKGWTPPIHKCVATRNEGVNEIVESLFRHRAWLEESDDGKQRRQARQREEMREALREALIDAAEHDLSSELESLTKEVSARAIDPYSAVERLVAHFRARASA